MAAPAGPTTAGMADLQLSGAVIKVQMRKDKADPHKMVRCFPPPPPGGVLILSHSTPLATGMRSSPQFEFYG
jgi:hypothetical protein